MSNRSPDSTISPVERRRLAVAAECSEPSVARFFAGGSMRPSVEARIARALVELGYVVPPKRAAR
jgi:DNA-binding LacI/PurR family transcriptional regulator